MLLLFALIAHPVGHVECGWAADGLGHDLDPAAPSLLGSVVLQDGPEGVEAVKAPEDVEGLAVGDVGLGGPRVRHVPAHAPVLHVQGEDVHRRSHDVLGHVRVVAVSAGHNHLPLPVVTEHHAARNPRSASQRIILKKQGENQINVGARNVLLKLHSTSTLE